MLTLPGQKSLFDSRTPAYNAQVLSVETAPHSGSETSRAAADAIVPSAATLRRMVYDWLLERREDGGTDEDIQVALSMAGNTERPRRQELEKEGLVVKTARTRATSSGRQAAVWVAKKFSEVPF